MQELEAASAAASTALQQAQEQHANCCTSLADLWGPLRQHTASLKASVDSLLELLPSGGEVDDAGAALLDLRKFIQARLLCCAGMRCMAHCRWGVLRASCSCGGFLGRY